MKSWNNFIGAVLWYLYRWVPKTGLDEALGTGSGLWAKSFQFFSSFFFSLLNVSPFFFEKN